MYVCVKLLLFRAVYRALFNQRLLLKSTCYLEEGASTLFISMDLLGSTDSLASR